MPLETKAMMRGTLTYRGYAGFGLVAQPARIGP